MAQRDVAINLLSKLQDKGFKDLEKSTKKSNKLLDGLGKKLLATFSVTAIAAYGKASVKAFIDEEKAIRRLNISLENTGQGFKALAAEDFISNLQRTARVADDELRPAFTRLINAGIDFEQSQKLLKTALDVSAGTGKDLETVTLALSRAFNGNNTALSRLGIGLSKAQLKAASFDDIIALVTAKFAGQADAAAESYAGRLAAISIAADEASETIGKGLVKALDLATGSSVGAETALSGVSTALSEIFVGIGAIIGETRSGGLPGYLGLINEAAKDLVRNGFNPLAAALDFFRGQGKTALGVTPTQLELVKKSIAEQKRAAELQKIIAKINAQIKQDTKKSDAEKKRSDAIEKLRKTIQYKFDIDAINQQAALRRNISASDKDRLLQLIALKTSDYQDDEEAIKTLQAATQGRYTEAMALEQMYALLKAAGFATDKALIEALAKLNPAIKFTDNLEDIRKQLAAIISGKYTVFIDIQTRGSVIAPAPSVPTAGIGGAPAAGAVVKPSITDPAKRIGEVIDAIDTQFFKQVVEGFTFGNVVGPNPAVTDLGKRVADVLDVTDTAFFNKAKTISIASPMNPAISNLGKRTGEFDLGGMTAGGDVNVTVNVSGSLISQNDLVQTITDAVYQSQRTGNPLLLEAL